MSQNLKLVINGVDLSTYLEQSTWTITQNWSRQGDTATFYLTDEHAANPTSLSFTVGPLATITLTDTGLNDTLFSGLVTQPQLKYLGPTLAYWQLDCTDWTYLADRALVQGDYVNMAADQLAISLTNQANCGISAVAASAGGYVQPGPVIPRIQMYYLTLTQAFTKISKIASLQGTYGWYIDENRNLHFEKEVDVVNSGITFTDNLSTTGPANTIAHYNADDFSYLFDASSLRNSVIVNGGTYTNNQTDLWVGDGSTNNFPLTYTPDTSNLGNATLLVGGVTKTLAQQTGTSANTQWVVVQNSVGEWFLTPGTDPVPAASTVIQLTYPYMAPVLSRVQDDNSITRFKSLPNGGVFGYFVTDSSLVTLLSGKQRGQRETFTYSQPEERITIQSTPDWGGHVRAGELIYVTNQMVPDTQNSNVPGLTNVQFLVVQSRITGQPGKYRTYTITAARIL